MTSQTKTFIEPSDIIGLRLKCQHSECGAEILVALDKPLKAERFATCPVCRRPWLRENNTSLEPAVDIAIARIEELSAGLKSHPWGVNVTLEIKPESLDE